MTGDKRKSTGNGAAQRRARAARRAGDETRFWRVPRFDDLDCLSARFETYSFSVHAHDTYGLAVILDGASRYRWRGTSYVAPAGSVHMMNPAEPHDGGPAETSFSYRCLYPSVTLMQRVARDVFDGGELDPSFGNTVVHDPELAASVASMHTKLEDGHSALEQESALTKTVALLLRRHAMPKGRLPRAGEEPRAVERVREVIEARLDEDISLEDLASEVALSRYHLLRVFQRHTGMTPHVYLMNRRVERARRLLAGGMPLAETALDCGFFDQSHFNRVFKRHAGITPGQYRRGGNPVQDRAA